jgi:hypothetical protein
MNLPGLCRLCGTQVPSYLAELHVLECNEIQLDPVREFADHYAYLFNSNSNTIIDIMKNISAYKYNVSQIPNDIFKSDELFHEFNYELEHLKSNIVFLLKI